MAETTLKINGSLVNMATVDIWPSLLDMRLGAVSTLSLTRRGQPLTPPADSLVNSDIELLIDDNVVFSGWIPAVQDSYSTSGYVASFQAYDLRDKADAIPFVDSLTGSNAAQFNVSPDDLLFYPSRTGLNVGEAIKYCLEMSTIAGPLNDIGIGGHTLAGGEYSLDSATLSDLSLLTIIPPQPLTIVGDGCLSAIQSFLQSVYPAVYLIVKPDGIVRFIRQDDFIEQTIDFDDCSFKANPPTVTRSIRECATAIKIRGQRQTRAIPLTLSNGGIVEDFTVGVWTPEDYYLNTSSKSEGTCTVSDTLTVVIDPTDATQSWAVDFLDQAHIGATIYLSVDVISGYTSAFTARVVANTALSAGGTCTLTLDRPLPSGDYTRYFLYGENNGLGLVYRRYKITDESIIERLARKFNPSAVWFNSANTQAMSTDFPMLSIVYPDGTEATDDFVYDLDGTITLKRPSYITAGNQVPADIRVLMAIYDDVLQVRVPETGYEGTAYTLNGREYEKQLYMSEWVDPLLTTRMEDYASHLLDSMKNQIIDVNVQLDKLWLPALTLGNAIEYDGQKLPITSASLTWTGPGTPTFHTLSMSASNRTAAQPALLPPSRPSVGYGIGSPTGDILTPTINKQEGGNG